MSAASALAFQRLVRRAQIWGRLVDVLRRVYFATLPDAIDAFDEVVGVSQFEDACSV